MRSSARYLGRMAVLSVADAGYTALTQGCALVEPEVDGKLALTGPQAGEFLGGQVSNDTEALAPGAGCYAALLTSKGKMLADLRVLHSGDQLLLITERATLQVLFDTLRRAIIGWDAELHKRTLERTRLVLVGPNADAVLAGAAPDGAALGAAEHDNAAAAIAEHEVLCVRTDSGVEVICAATDADAVRAALRDADDALARTQRALRGDGAPGPPVLTPEHAAQARIVTTWLAANDAPTLDLRPAPGREQVAGLLAAVGAGGLSAPLLLSR
jgi:glycine cleavage system aminomethyltransferase T